MDIAQLDGMSLFGERGARSGGAAFRLTSAAPKTGTVRIGSRWKVSVHEGSEALVVGGGRSTSYSAAWQAALEVAHRGLDLLAVSGFADLSIQNADEDHLVWWFEGSRLIMRIFAILTSSFQVSATLTVRDAAGHMVRQPRTKQVWHESFRFFRLAQVTEDIFDAYRNLYLALECVLDDRYPKGRRESESVWLRRALGQIHSFASLAAFAATNSRDPVADIVDELYSTTRTGVCRRSNNSPG